ncbi:MAG: hypothetical protein KKC79_13625, partial [Gammaproteobacteria bacterium]|nr:hypothetical protein [Gammaproteobacteria bacterium]
LACLFAGSCMAARGQGVDDSLSAEVPRVVEVRGNLELDEIVQVRIIGLSAWTRIQGNTPWKIVPFLNGRALSGNYPAAVNVRAGTLQFHLRMTPESKSAWHNVLSPPTLTRPVRFSVGLELQDPFDTSMTLESNPAQLVVMEPEWALAALVMGIVFAISFAWLSATTPILLERVDRADGAAVRFSLAKVQLAVWFFVIFGAFIVIWLATGNYDTINGSIVSVLGISAGTALGDSYIKSNQEAQKQTPDATSDDPAIGKTVAIRSAFGHGGLRIRLARAAKDLLSDSEGYSIYRFQIVAWTVVLTTIFVSGVYYQLAMPEFKPDLLYLLGLSAGTYIAHRLPETLRETRIASSSGIPYAASMPADSVPSNKSDLKS